MTPLAVAAVGPLPNGLLEHVAEFLNRGPAGPARILPDVLDPAIAFDVSRRQFDARVLLPLLERLSETSGARVLGVADVDLFSPIFTFVFGEARVGGRAALFSTARLRNTFYGLPEDQALLLARARREALHETAHMSGLLHCRHPECVMRFSAAVEEVDLKEDRLCDACLERFRLDRANPA